MEQTKIHPVDEKLSFGKLLIYGLQHVLAMYSGAVAVPLILASAIHLDTEQLIYLINADLFTCGVATLIQTLGVGPKVGAKLPIVQGCTFGAVTTMIMIGGQHGLQGIYGSIIVAGFLTFIFSTYFSKMLRFFPPVVTGTVITIIGLSLLPVAVNWIGGGNPKAPDFCDPGKIYMALLVLLIVLICYRCFTGFISNIAVLLGLVLGTVVAAFFGFTDFSVVGKAAAFGVTTPFHFGMPIFDPASIFAMTVVMMVVMTETTGDVMAIGEIVDKKVDENVLSRALRADGFSTMLGGIFNAFPYTAFAQNVGLVSLTGVRSRFVVAMAGVILMVLGLFPKLAAIVACIPNSVLGGAGIAMFGMVAASGIKTLSKVDFDHSYNMMIVAVSIGIALIPLGVPTFYNKFPVWAQLFMKSGITVGSVTAILLNIILNGMPKTDKKEEVARKEYL
jgi:uric acid transporter